MKSSANPEISIAICTRDRPESLKKSLISLTKDVANSDISSEFLIVDDGELSNSEITFLRSLCKRAGAAFRCYRKPISQRGLYLSRKVAVAETRAPIILFVDDDIEISEGYLRGILSNFDDETIAGVGGVDRKSLPEGNGRIGNFMGKFFLMNSGYSGRLSETSMNFSQSLWRMETKSFETDFLHGCNMAFRRKFLSHLPNIPWLSGHSACEDLVISHVARQSGKLRIDVSLGIRHHSIEGGRGNSAEQISTKLRNCAMFDSWRHEATKVRPIFFWSAIGLALKDIAQVRSGRYTMSSVLNGYKVGIRDIAQAPLVTV